MPKVFFQLGHSPDLSHAEIVSVNQLHGGPLQERQRVDDAFLEGACDSLEAVQPLMPELGGAIRLGEWLAEGETIGQADEGAETLAQRILSLPVCDEWQGQSGKLVVGVSMVETGKALGGRRKAYGFAHDLGDALKHQLTETGRSVRMVLPGSDKATFVLNGAQVEKNRLLKRGGELVLHVDGQGGVRAGLTRQLQPFEAYSKRDYGRPQRDPRSGMLPPKLARMLINLARQPQTHTLLDPFCGSGSLLMEAALLGLQPVGCDSSKKAIEDTRANNEWLQNQFPEVRAIRAVEGDAGELRKHVEPLFFDCCVTEPDLGPPQSRPVSPEKIGPLLKRLSALYLRALGEIRTVVRPGARVVFLMPRFVVEGKNQPAVFRLLPDLRLQGYTLLDPLQGFAPTAKRATLVYARPKQVVQREVFVLQA